MPEPLPLAPSDMKEVQLLPDLHLAIRAPNIVSEEPPEKLNSFMSLVSFRQSLDRTHDYLTLHFPIVLMW